MNGFNKIARKITLLTQFSLTLIVPILVCLWLCWWATEKHGVGLWIYIPGFIFGLGGSFMSAYKFYLEAMLQEKKKEKENKKTVSFNRHV